MKDYGKLSKLPHIPTPNYTSSTWTCLQASRGVKHEAIFDRKQSRNTAINILTAVCFIPLNIFVSHVETFPVFLGYTNIDGSWNVIDFGVSFQLL